MVREPTRFLVSATTGGGTGKSRLQIWNASTGAIFYDSQPGAAINAAPVTRIKRRQDCAASQAFASAPAVRSVRLKPDLRASWALEECQAKA